MSVIRTGLGIVVAAGSVAALAALSAVPWTPEPGPEAVVRLSWRARGERVEVCRDLSAEELEALPQHMRRDRVCEGTTAEYRLRVEVNEEERVDQRVQGSGEIQVRPLYVYRELRLPPGRYRLGVRLERVSPEDTGEEGEEEPKPGRGLDAAVPRRLELERTVLLRPREVVLVTYDPERQALVLRSTPPP